MCPRHPDPCTAAKPNSQEISAEAAGSRRPHTAATHMWRLTVAIVLALSLRQGSASKPELILQDELLAEPESGPTPDQLQEAHAAAVRRHEATHLKRQLEHERRAERRATLVQLIVGLIVTSIVIVGISDCWKMWRRRRTRHETQEQKDV